MKAIIKNGVANKDIQSCLISECGVEITLYIDCTIEVLAKSGK